MAVISFVVYLEKGRRTLKNMPEILFKLRNVPDDEADEIRDLLTKNNIEFYETPASRWGVSMEAIWLPEDTCLEQAKQLIDDYQTQRYQRVTKEYEDLKQKGEVESFLSRVARRPIQTIAIVVFIAVIVYFVTMPFIKISMN